MIALELPERARAALLAELRAMKEDPDGTTIRTRDDREVVRLTGVDVRRIARALDHMRNADVGGREARDERDRLLLQLRAAGDVPLTYRLRSWQFDWNEQDRVFWSYTGAYEEGDRLVTMDGEAFVVTQVVGQATPIDGGLLTVERAS